MQPVGSKKEKKKSWCSWISGSKPESILHPMRQLVVSGDIFVCHKFSMCVCEGECSNYHSFISLKSKKY